MGLVQVHVEPCYAESGFEDAEIQIQKRRYCAEDAIVADEHSPGVIYRR